MTIFRSDKRLATLAVLIWLAGCGQSDGLVEADAVAEDVAPMSSVEDEVYDDIANRDKANASKETFDYSVEDFALPKTETSIPSNVDHDRLQSDLQQQEVDRRIRALEQDAELRQTEDDLRRANERVEALKSGR